MQQRLVFALVICGWLAVDARAQPSAPAAPGSAWESLSVPGRVSSLLRAAGLDEARPRTTALRDVIRVLYASPEHGDTELDALRAQVVGHVITLARFERAASAFGADMPELARAADRDVRRRLDDLAAAIGHTLERVGTEWRLTLAAGDGPAARRQYLEAAGVHAGDLAARFNRGESVALSLPADDVPLPLPASVWRAALPVRREFSGSLLASIVGDRPSALLYYGLMAVDPATRQYLGERPALLSKLGDLNRAGAFAGFGRSVRIDAGRVHVPGGPDAQPLWEALAGASVLEPERFVAALFEKGRGRLALLYDTATCLDESRRRFLMGSWDPDGESRLRRFRRLYEVMQPPLAGWDPRLRPFYRNRYDLAHLLSMTRVNEDGRPAGPRGDAFWRRVFESGNLPPDPLAAVNDADSRGEIDASGMVEVLAPLDYSAPRAEVWWFAHRRFTSASPAQLPDVFVTLRGFERYRVLAATLERMGITEPEVFAAATIQADRVTSVGDQGRARTALALFQSAVVLVERARLGRVIDAAQAAGLIRSLCAVPLSAAGDYQGGVGVWLSGAYLPEVGRGLANVVDRRSERGAEVTILSAFAGRPLGPADSANLKVTVEGLAYVVDLAGGELTRLQQIRRKQRSVPVDAALQVVLAASALRGDGVTPAQLPGLVSDAERAAGALLEAPGAPAFDRDGFKARVSRVLGDLRGMTDARRIGDLGEAASVLLREGDQLLARALVALVYAPHLDDPDGFLLLDGGPADRHDWALDAPPLDAPVPNPWLVPREERGRAGWFLRGSLLGMDIALGSLALRRVVADRVPVAPSITDSERFAVTDQVVLANPFDCRDATRDAIVAALVQGRARLEAVRAAPRSWPDAAAEAGIADLRRDMLAWTLAHEPDRFPEFLSMGEVLRLGSARTGPIEDLDAWGTSGRWVDGRWSLVYPRDQPLEFLAGRRGSALVATLLPDLALSVAESLAARGLPAVLARHVLAAAVQDFIDEVRLAYEDDWLATITLVPALSARVDDYIAVLTMGGPLVPEGRRE